MNGNTKIDDKCSSGNEVEVSIITPVYNSAEYLEETILSIINQTFNSWESILIDDGSTDGSVEIIKRYQKLDGRFRVITKQVCEGAAKARNQGILEAKGRFIAFLDSDDIWNIDKLEKQIFYMKKNEVAFCFSGYDFITEQGVLGKRVVVPDIVSYHSLLKGNIIACLTVVYDTNVLGKVFMPDILKRQDFGLWLKITKRGVDAIGMQESLAKYRLRTQSLSHAKFNTAKYTWMIYREIEKINLIWSLFYMFNHLFRASVKRLINKLTLSRGL